MNSATTWAHPPRVQPRLLVSVRDLAEAQAALAGGVDILDFKDPHQGSLGRPSWDLLRNVVETLSSEVSPAISAALGELCEVGDIAPQGHTLSRLTWVKVGLSRFNHTDWKSTWHAFRQRLSQVCSPRTAPGVILVVYADWKLCAAPAPADIIEFATQTDSPGVLFDTYLKDGRTLLDHLSPRDLQPWIEDLHAHGRFVALAGRVGQPQLPELMRLQPDIIAVRSAVCASDRMSPVVAEKVAAFQATLAAASPTGGIRH